MVLYFHTSAIFIQNFKIRVSFIHQSYHHLKNLILNAEKKLSVYNIKISLQTQLGPHKLGKANKD